MIKNNDLMLELYDDEWPLECIDHDRLIARAIVFDEEGYLYFVKLDRDDEFGRSLLIETSGGGVEPGEELIPAIKRELKEELGADVEVIEELGIVSDRYNLIRRHNINHYFLCKALSFGEKSLTEPEMDQFHLTTLRLTPQEARTTYDKCRNCKLGRLIANREIPILELAEKRILLYRSTREASKGE